MRLIFRSAITALSVAVLCVSLLSGGTALAQAPAAQAQAAPSAQQPEALNQITLTDSQIQNLLAAQKDMDAIIDKLPEDSDDNLPPKLQAQLEEIAKKNGFATYDAYSDVAANVSLVLSGIDSKTKTFTEPSELLKKQIADITADKKLPEKDKKAALADMNEALQYTPRVQFPANVALVTKYYDQLSAAFLSDQD